ncbi:MAG: hypothetical protein LBU05_03620 [Bifidobacteriaceae bacterium]|jgi:hypothetical protein|nr:hypothetical protein [Bifidobacteriaceae bacterium]
MGENMPYPQRQSNNPTFVQGVAMIIGGVIVFMICSIIQNAGDSSMFSLTFHRQDSTLLNLLLKFTWWPGWILTVVLIVTGVKILMSSQGEASKPSSPRPSVQPYRQSAESPFTRSSQSVPPPLSQSVPPPLFQPGAQPFSQFGIPPTINRPPELHPADSGQYTEPTAQPLLPPGYYLGNDGQYYPSRGIPQ